jgi:hypothetical protein
MKSEKKKEMRTENGKETKARATKVPSGESSYSSEFLCICYFH